MSPSQDTLAGGRPRGWPLAAALALALASSCVPIPPPDPSMEVGLASFYHSALGGRRTASGSQLDLDAFTCAHRSHPFGTKLRVTVLDTGSSAVVEVTDRGPFVAGRVIDVTPAVARRLGFSERGLARVRVEVAGP